MDAKGYEASCHKEKKELVDKNCDHQTLGLRHTRLVIIYNLSC